MRISCFSVVYRRITVDYHSIISPFQAVKLPFRCDGTFFPLMRLKHFSVCHSWKYYRLMFTRWNTLRSSTENSEYPLYKQFFMWNLFLKNAGDVSFAWRHVINKALIGANFVLSVLILEEKVLQSAWNKYNISFFRFMIETYFTREHQTLYLHSWLRHSWKY